MTKMLWFHRCIRLGRSLPRILKAVNKSCVSTPLRSRTIGLTVRMASTAATDVEGQCTDMVYMVRPTYFGFNATTAVDNAFQKHLEGLAVDQARKRASGEFEDFVAKLKSKKIRVHIGDCSNEVATDAVFPNNVISFHNEDGKPRIALYPMMAENRRLERQPALIAYWRQILEGELVDYTAFEQEEKFLEGTGSMVLDRVNRIAYSCKSQRTHPVVLEKFCKDFGYKPIIFNSTQKVNGKDCPIYHTNVMLSVCDHFAVIGLETIRDPEEQTLVRETLENTGKEVIPISDAQLNNFAGNSLQLCNADGDKFFVCSTKAFNSFESHQLSVIRKYCCDILHVSLDTIETLGGGGARCMLCEVFPSPE